LTAAFGGQTTLPTNVVSRLALALASNWQPA